jgi:dethiobiotin synthetase
MSSLPTRSFIVLDAGEGDNLTLVSVALLRALVREGVRAIGMRPVARGHLGAGGLWHSDELRQLADASAFELPLRALATRLLDAAAPPPTERGAAPPLEAVVDNFHALSTWADVVVVDGAAGTRSGAAELARVLGLPFVFVAGAEPVANGQAAAAARALTAQGLECAGWVAANPSAGTIDTTPPERARVDVMPGPWLGARLRRPSAASSGGDGGGHRSGRLPNREQRSARG